MLEIHERLAILFVYFEFFVVSPPEVPGSCRHSNWPGTWAAEAVGDLLAELPKLTIHVTLTCSFRLGAGLCIRSEQVYNIRFVRL